MQLEEEICRCELRMAGEKCSLDSPIAALARECRAFQADHETFRRSVQVRLCCRLRGATAAVNGKSSCPRVYALSVA